MEVAREIVVPRKLDGRTERRISLHKNFACCFTTTRTTSDLGQELKGPLACAEVRHMEREIGVDDSDQRHIRKMQTLRDHLGADEDVDLARAEVTQRLAICLFARHRVRIHAAHDRSWKNLGNSRFDLLGAEPGINERVLSAGWTFLRYGRGVSAQMTAQSRHVSMKRQSHAAVRAIACFTAFTAKQRSGKAAAI